MCVYIASVCVGAIVRVCVCDDNKVVWDALLTYVCVCVRVYACVCVCVRACV